MVGETTGASPRPQRPPLWLWVGGAVFLTAFATILVASVRRPDTSVFTLSPDRPRERPVTLTGPDTVTLDAGAGDRWTRFDLGRRRVAGPGESWDIAVRRNRLAVNGGAGFSGDAGVARLGASLESVSEAPVDGYAVSSITPDGDTVNRVLDDWYDYSFLSHLLEPASGTFVLRTADGHYAKLAVLSYYCPGPRAGCMTIAYVYQGDGSRRLNP